jgi:hypothetical protein
VFAVNVKAALGWPLSARMRTFSSTESDLSTICTTDEWEPPDFLTNKPKLPTTPASSVTSCLSDVHKVNMHIYFKDFFQFIAWEIKKMILRN